MTAFKLVRRPRALAVVLGTALAAGCLAPPPPIVVETPFGDVRAETRDTAIEIAELLLRLAPEVQAHLPGSQDRSIDVWVQDELRVYRHKNRPESVRGFTLLADEFDARRIHLQADRNAPWYLAHELVHALIGTSWSTLPGILEEGLADVIACEVNAEHRGHIRAHRLLNASAFTNGIELELAYRVPAGDVASDGLELRRSMLLRITEPVAVGRAREILTMSRSQLHHRWPDIPESYYGIAWLIVSRIHERVGLEALHDLCRRAEAEGHSLVPIDWLFDAAELDLDELTPRFLASCFNRREFQRAIFLQPEAFSKATWEGLAHLQEGHGRADARELFRNARPAFVLRDGSRIHLSTIPPVKEMFLDLSEPSPARAVRDP